MTRRTMNHSAAAAALLLLAVSLPVLAGEGAPPPVASVEVAGTLFTMLPYADFERALLRISGPDGYTLSKAISAFSPTVTADLLADMEPGRADEAATPASEARAARTTDPEMLRDGRYIYELVLFDELGQRHVQSGSFSVAGGTPVVREAGPRQILGDEPIAAAPAEQETTLAPRNHEHGDFNDFVSIRNVTGTGVSRLNLNATNDIVIGADTWRLVNNAATNTFEIVQGGATSRLVMRQGGNVGLGVGNPLSPLHIERLGGFQIRLQGQGADYRIDSFGTSLRIGDSTNTNQFRIFGADAPFNALVVRDAIGIGTENPLADLDLRDLNGNAITNIRFATGSHAWTNAVPDSSGNFIFNRQGTGGPEFVVTERFALGGTLVVHGTVNELSSSTIKTGFEDVDPVELLAKLTELPVTFWRYKEDRRGGLHIGPVAEDFQRLFGLGDGMSISSADSRGVMMAAIQGLKQLLDAKDAEIAEVRQINEALEARLAAIEARLTDL